MSGEVNLLLASLAGDADGLRIVTAYDSQPYYIVINPGNQEIAVPVWDYPLLIILIR